LLALALSLLIAADLSERLTALPAVGSAFAGQVVGAAAVLEGETPPALFQAQERAVTTWRVEAARDLAPGPIAGLAAAFDLGRPLVTRCVKLNNYWCIKRAGWNGEVGFDDEGHTAFASAEYGADAAVSLLRRYYRDYGRTSALAIVRRWAPAECRTFAASASGGGPVGAIGGLPLALKGIQFTARARYLASRRGGRPVRAARPPVRVAANGPVAIGPIQSAKPVTDVNKPPAETSKPAAQAVRRPAARPAARISAVPLRPLPAIKLPGIMAGAGAGALTIAASLPDRAPVLGKRPPTPAVARAPGKPAPVQVPSVVAPRLAAVAPGLPSIPAAPVCGADEGRIQNYAGQIARSVGRGPNDDLQLFGPDGEPLPNLMPVMLAMSGVELGLLRARVELVAAAIERARPVTQAEPPAPDPTTGEGR
jgi:hypothetical protein